MTSHCCKACKFMTHQLKLAALAMPFQSRNTTTPFHLAPAGRPPQGAAQQRAAKGFVHPDGRRFSPGKGAPPTYIRNPDALLTFRGIRPSTCPRTDPHTVKLGPKPAARMAEDEPSSTTRTFPLCFRSSGRPCPPDADSAKVTEISKRRRCAVAQRLSSRTLHIKCGE